MKKLLITFLILVLALTTFGCAGSSDESEGTTDEAANLLKVAYINSADTDVFDAMRKDALTSVLDESKHDVTFYDSNKDIQKQLDYVDNAITDKVDLIILVPVDGEGAVPGVEAANAAGIPVICLGINAAGGDYTFVGSDHYVSGHMQGTYMATVLPQDAKVLYMEGSPGYDHTRLRKQGFEEAITEAGRSDVKIIASQTANYDKAEAMTLMENWIQQYGADGFDAVVAANDQMALGSMEAMKVAGITGKQIAGIDATADACQAIIDGTMTYTLKQDAAGQGKMCLTVMEDLAAGKTLEKQYLVPYTDVDKTNAAEIKG